MFSHRVFLFFDGGGSVFFGQAGGWLLGSAKQVLLLKRSEVDSLIHIQNAKFARNLVTVAPRVCVKGLIDLQRCVALPSAAPHGLLGNRGGHLDLCT